MFKIQSAGLEMNMICWKKTKGFYASWHFRFISLPMQTTILRTFLIVIFNRKCLIETLMEAIYWITLERNELEQNEESTLCKKLPFSVCETVMSMCLPVKMCFRDRQFTYLVWIVVSSPIIYI